MTKSAIVPRRRCDTLVPLATCACAAQGRCSTEPFKASAVGGRDSGGGFDGEGQARVFGAVMRVGESSGGKGQDSVWG